MKKLKFEFKILTYISAIIEAPCIEVCKIRGTYMLWKRNYVLASFNFLYQLVFMYLLDEFVPGDLDFNAIFWAREIWGLSNWVAIAAGIK